MLSIPDDEVERLRQVVEGAELDRSEHGPLAAQMLQNLCGCRRSRWQEATSAAVSALEGRGRLWDAVLEKVAAR